jgi:hypothetical protein
VATLGYCGSLGIDGCFRWIHDWVIGVGGDRVYKILGGLYEMRMRVRAPGCMNFPIGV